MPRTANGAPRRPILGVGAIILDGDDVLLIQRGGEPLAGYWSIPGGKVEFGETLEEALRREMREELAMEIRIEGLAELFERQIRDEAGQVQHHYVLADYWCTTRTREFQAGDDAADARWVPRSGLGSLRITAGTPLVIEKAFRLRDQVR